MTYIGSEFNAADGTNNLRISDNHFRGNAKHIGKKADIRTSSNMNSFVF